MFTTLQVLLVCIFVFAYSFVGWSVQIFAYGVQVMIGFIVGLIMGDVQTGLLVGGTLCLMGLGIGGYGGSSVPDYALGTVVGTCFAVTTGGGIEAGLAIGIPTATLGVQFDVLSKMAGSFFFHREVSAVDRNDWKSMGAWVWGWTAFRSVFYTLPVLLVMTVGSNAINSILLSIPVWLTNGLTVVAGMLPALGFAILLKYLPVRKFGVFIILGFVLTAYLNMPMLGVALFTAVIAYLIFMYLEDKDKLAKTALVTGDDEDE